MCRFTVEFWCEGTHLFCKLVHKSTKESCWFSSYSIVNCIDDLSELRCPCSDSLQWGQKTDIIHVTFPHFQFLVRS